IGSVPERLTTSEDVRSVHSTRGPRVRRIPQKISRYSAPGNCGIPQCVRAASAVFSNRKSQMDSQQELLEGLLQLMTMAEGERKLLAADLHDQTLSDLRQLSLIARRLVDKPERELSGEMRDGLIQIACGLDDAMDEVRRAMESLSPSALDTLGLFPAIESCLARASATCERSFETRVACLVNEDQFEFSEIEKMLLFRIVQEALNNISRHAGARSVELIVTRLGRDLLIRVMDDGRGMTLSGDLRRARGIDNMRFRARL